MSSSSYVPSQPYYLNESAAPVPITVTIENWGPERRFEVVLKMEGSGNPASASVSVPHMGRGSVEVPVPECGYESPRDT